MICTVRAIICGSAMASPAPPVFMFMNARTAKVDGKMHENHLQKAGKLLSGQENPVRNRQTTDISRNITKTVSLCLMNVLKVKLNTTHADTKNSNSTRISPKGQFWGSPIMRGARTAT